MKRKNSLLIKSFLFVLIIGIMTGGCSSKKDMIKEENAELEGDITQKEYEGEISLNVGGKDYDLLARSEGISDVVVNLYGIENASSIILNDMVAVAVKITEESTLTDDMKEMIINAVLENDSNIRQVLITDNEKIFDEIENVIGSLLNGNPYDDQIKKINSIIEKIKNE